MSGPADIIRKKRDGAELEPGELADFVSAIARDRVGDAQLGAFLMAVYCKGLSTGERVAMTLAMRDSGVVLDWRGLDGPVLDKHSTGGVGDLVSLVLGPLMAACGAYVPMISGRGLSHTGGTLDKLEAIPGFLVSLDPEHFQAIVREAGVAIAGQGPALAPADGRMYAVRDVTATVGSEPLIVASILSKKLAEGLDGLVLDVKCGNGAFMADEQHAVHLARALTEVAHEAGLECSALITDMNQPLADSAGNALEVQEAIRFLTGEHRSARLEAVILALARELLVSGAIEADPVRAETLLRTRLDDGSAAERFARMVSLQGGPADLLERPGEHLAAAPVIGPCMAGRAGTVVAIDTLALGACVGGLGGGRRRTGDTIDPRVGLSGICKLGDQLGAGDPLAVIHAASKPDWEKAALDVGRAVSLGAGPGEPGPVIRGRYPAH